MPDQTNPPRELQSTYFVQDRANQDEMTRLQIQDQMLTRGMGGVLPEQADPTRFQRVLDVGCGTGNWLIEAAKTYPTMSRLVGVDISSKMLAYARTQAEAHQVSDRVTFRVMDALRWLDFPANSFDLVNHRMGSSYLRQWDWPKLLEEYQRVARQDGVIRITECFHAVESNSPALTRLHELFIQAFYNAGHLFVPQTDGLVSRLSEIMRQQGLQPIQTQKYELRFAAGTPDGQSYYEDTRHFFRTLKPFLQKWLRLPDDYERIYQQALTEMQEPGFQATWPFLTAWGTPSPDKMQSSSVD
jgi:ubiquinone/menaquinone biosynthesis C-methylase UbiE